VTDRQIRRADHRRYVSEHPGEVVVDTVGPAGRRRSLHQRSALMDQHAPVATTVNDAGRLGVAVVAVADAALVVADPLRLVLPGCNR